MKIWRLENLTHKNFSTQKFPNSQLCYSFKFSLHTFKFSLPTDSKRTPSTKQLWSKRTFFRSGLSSPSVLVVVLVACCCTVKGLSVGISTLPRLALGNCLSTPLGELHEGLQNLGHTYMQLINSIHYTYTWNCWLPQYCHNTVQPRLFELVGSGQKCSGNREFG